LFGDAAEIIVLADFVRLAVEGELQQRTDFLRQEGGDGDERVGESTGMTVSRPVASVRSGEVSLTGPKVSYTFGLSFDNTFGVYAEQESVVRLLVSMHF
jgi:hypothetical protein